MLFQRALTHMLGRGMCYHVPAAHVPLGTRGTQRGPGWEAGARQDAESQKEEQEWESEDYSLGEVLG